MAERDAGIGTQEYAELASHLERGERVLWNGTPRKGLMFRTADIFLVPFTVLWCSFAVFWEVMAAAGHAPAFFLLFGAMFVCVGLYMVFGRFAADILMRARTIYAVTNQRVLILSGITRRNVRSLYLDGLTEFELSERSSGRGTITFGRSAMPFANMFGRGWPGSGGQMSPAFEDIEAASDVNRIIREARNALRQQLA